MAWHLPVFISTQIATGIEGKNTVYTHTLIAAENFLNGFTLPLFFKTVRLRTNFRSKILGACSVVRQIELELFKYACVSNEVKGKAYTSHTWG